MATDKYKIEKVENELILTVKHENFANKVSGDKIKVTVKHNGYMDASGEITILDAVYNVTLNTNGGVLANESDNITNYTQGTVVTLPTPILGNVFQYVKVINLKAGMKIKILPAIKLQ